MTFFDNFVYRKIHKIIIFSHFSHIWAENHQYLWLPKIYFLRNRFTKFKYLGVILFRDNVFNEINPFP